MKVFLISLCVLVMMIHACNSSDSIEYKWNKFKKEFKKYYSKTENTVRKAIFAKTLNEIAEHAEKFKQGKVSYEMGLNEFADMTDAEFRAEYANDVPFDPVFGRAEKARNVSSRSVPSSVNWVNYGYKNPITSQRNCGSCYAFAAIASLEGQYYIKHKKLITLSQQELVDCSKAYGNYGCRGGLQRNVYRYMLAQKGVGYSKNNLYTAKEKTCSKKTPRVAIKRYYEIPSGNEEALKKAVANVGPIPIDMNASLSSFKNYKSGVYYSIWCQKNRLTHAMTVVGYGTSDRGEDYWLVRNSWGPKWGEKGYIRMARNRGNNCGVATRAVYPIIA